MLEQSYNPSAVQLVLHSSFFGLKWRNFSNVSGESAKYNVSWNCSCFCCTISWHLFNQKHSLQFYCSAGEAKGTRKCKQCCRESRLKDTVKDGKNAQEWKTFPAQRSANNEILLILLETKAKYSSKENAVSLLTQEDVKTPKGIPLTLYKSSALSSMCFNTASPICKLNASYR